MKSSFGDFETLLLYLCFLTVVFSSLELVGGLRKDRVDFDVGGCSLTKDVLRRGRPISLEPFEPIISSAPAIIAIIIERKSHYASRMPTALEKFPKFGSHEHALRYEGHSTYLSSSVLHVVRSLYRSHRSLKHHPLRRFPLL